MGLSREGYFLGDFLKICLDPPIALFQKMLVLGDLEKFAITWPFANFWRSIFLKKSFPVFAL